jgi:hypothetical protein
LDWTELMEPANLPHLREGKFMEISGFHTTWQWQKNFFSASAVVVGEYADARGTEAVKLSVKLLSVLTLVAFVAVAVIGLSHSASAAADAKVYVTNKASGLTTEPSTAVVGRTSATTVYGTYASYASTGTTARDIVANSDIFIVTVIDADLNTSTTITDNEASTSNLGYAATGSGTSEINIVGAGFNAAGEQIQITLAGQSANPIIGAVGDVKIHNTGAGGAAVAGVSVSAINFAGDGTNAPIVTLKINYGTGPSGNIDIVYPSSKIDDTTVTIKSVVYTGAAAVLTLTETGRNTGRFEGEVLVKERVPAFVTGTAGDTGATRGTVPAIGGPITVNYVDAVTSGTATNVARTGSYKLDVTVPTATISAPATGSETQDRLPTFTGTITDNLSGLDVSLFSLNIDNTTDVADANNVIAAGATRGSVLPDNSNVTLPGVIGKVASIALTATQIDGIATLPFTYKETVLLPNAGVTNPDHIVDYQVRAADLAGNYGYSDSSSTVGNFNSTGRHGAQPHTVKIDQKIPAISSVLTGSAYDPEVPLVNKTNIRDSIKVTFDGKIKDTSVTASDFKVTLSGAGGVFVPASIVVDGADVYLDLDSTIPSDNKPVVAINGTVQDLAGNNTSSGSATATDGLAPVLTVTQSGGSATSNPSGLTKSTIVVTVSSDEDLQGPPAITVTDLTPDPDVTVATFNGALAVSQGSNSWALTITAAGSASGNRAVSVAAADTAGNTATSGKVTTKTYVLDLAVAASVSTPGATTSQANPFFTTAFTADQSTLTVTSATLTTGTDAAVDVTADVIASADAKTFFYQPTTALTNAAHKYIVKVEDAAGNKATVTTTTTKSDRTDYVVELFAGWNSVSLPSNPLDTGVDTVLSNTGIKQVVAYDATTPAQPWRIASKVDDGDYSSQTTPGLSTVTAGAGYWIETSDFEDQTVALEGPTGPGDARPGLTTIATGNGWNLVGVVDQSRQQTEKAHKGATLTRPNSDGSADVAVTYGSYLATVNNGRAYTFDTVKSEFFEQTSTDNVSIGSGVWVFISPQTNGQLPHIVP